MDKSNKPKLPGISRSWESYSSYVPKELEKNMPTPLSIYDQYQEKFQTHMINAKQSSTIPLALEKSPPKLQAIKSDKSTKKVRENFRSTLVNVVM